MPWLENMKIQVVKIAIFIAFLNTFAFALNYKQRDNAASWNGRLRFEMKHGGQQYQQMVLIENHQAKRVGMAGKKVLLPKLVFWRN